MERDGQKRREGSNVMILLALFFSSFSSSLSCFWTRMGFMMIS